LYLNAQKTDEGEVISTLQQEKGKGLRKERGRTRENRGLARKKERQDKSLRKD